MRDNAQHDEIVALKALRGTHQAWIVKLKDRIAELEARIIELETAIHDCREGNV